MHIQLKKYLAKGAVYCPFCESDQIFVITELEGNGQDAWQDVKCAKCGRKWTDIYKIVDIKELEE